MGAPVLVVRMLAGTVAAAGLIAAGCSSGDGASGTSTGSDSESQTFEFGGPAEAADAARVIEIDADDEFTFNPDAVEVETGEVITFSVTNTGNLDHEFTLGPEEVQEEHEAEMADMGDMDMDDDPNAISVPPGETRELTWQFAEAGTVLMGCHTQGHWAAGMRGEIDVIDSA